MEIIGYVASLIIGISLGLIGGGGSILTVPVLVYLFGVEPVLATAYSLFIVGSTSLVGAYPKYKKGLINLKTALIFGVPAIAAVYATRKFIVPLIPDTVFHLGEIAVTKGLLMMLLFAVLMVFASISMIRKKDDEVIDIVHDLPGDITVDTVHPVVQPIPSSNKTVANTGYSETAVADLTIPRVAVGKIAVTDIAVQQQQVFNYPLILVEGIVVGILTGLVGAGGGFLIIPALVLLSKLPMKQAVGTSLLIIAAKSLIGFTGDLSNYAMNWKLLIIVTIIAIAGIFIGNWLTNKVSSDKLKRGFGWFVLVMGFYIIIKEVFFPGGGGGH
jgi:uncharacterized protein